MWIESSVLELFAFIMYESIRKYFFTYVFTLELIINDDL